VENIGFLFLKNKDGIQLLFSDKTIKILKTTDQMSLYIYSSLKFFKLWNEIENLFQNIPKKFRLQMSSSLNVRDKKVEHAPNMVPMPPLTQCAI
jgi:hypothetical protein